MAGKKTHMHLHAGEWPYSCEVHNTSFTGKRHLGDHYHIYAREET